MIEERTEQLINRRLDGELSDAESLELDRLLIRSPEARRLLEEYQQLDGLAGETLQSCFQVPATERFAGADAVADPPAAHRANRLNWAMGIAAAAMIALVLAGLPSRWAPSGETPGPVTNQPAPIAGPSQHVVYTSATDSPVSGTRNERQRVTSNVIGVMDEDGKTIYLLEVQRKDTTITPVAHNY